MRLIDADALMDDMDGDLTDSIAERMALEKIMNAPTIKEEPQRIKGRWERKESDLSWWYECSECGESPLFDPYEHEVRSPFCPWCGARMEEEEDAVD